MDYQTRRRIPSEPTETAAVNKSDHAASPTPINPTWTRLATRAAGQGASDGGGKRLPDEVQTKMTDAFGLDLSGLRVHEDNRPAALGARAFAQGADIHMAPGYYEPQTRRGQTLLAHEIAHSIQQAQGRVHGPTTRIAGTPVHEGAALEHEADQMATNAVAGRSAGAHGVGDRPTALAPSSSQAPAVLLDKQYVPIKVHFDKDITGEEFMRIADLQIFGTHPAPGEWSKVPSHLEASDSPRTVQVDLSLLKRVRGEGHGDLGVDVDDSGKLEGADERAAKFSEMPSGHDKRALMAEIDERYWKATGLPKGSKIKDKAKEQDKVEVWNQIRDELLLEREFVQNLPEKVQYILRYSPDGIEVGPSDYAQVVRIARKIATMDLEDLENYLRDVSETASLDTLETGIDEFLAQKQASADQIADLMELVDDDDWDVDTEAGKLTTTQMFYLTLDQRKQLIDTISDGSVVGDGDEATLIRLLLSTPAAQQPALLEWLKQDGAQILARLESVIDGSENKQLYAAYRNLVLQELSPEELMAKMESAKLLPWADPGVVKAAYTRRFYYETVEYTDDGKIKVEYWINFNAVGVKTQAQYFEPDEIVGLYFFMDEDFAGASEGEIIYIPAAALLSFKNEQFSRELSLVVDVGLLAAGGAGLLAKGGRLAKAIAAFDVALAATDIVINSYRAEIAKTDEGKAFLRAWDTVNTLIAVYGLARVVLALPKAVRNLRKAYQDFKSSKHGLDPNDMKKLDGEAQKLLDEAEKLAFEKRLEGIRGTHTPEQLAAFEKDLERVSGIADSKKRAAALDVVEDQIATQKHNTELVERLKRDNPNAGNKEIADLAKGELKVPDVPIGYSAEEWADAQAWVKQYLEAKGRAVESGFATGSRITGTTFNPKKPSFGQRKADFSGSDLDITVVTDGTAMSKSQINKMTKAFSEQFPGRKLGVRHIPESQKAQLDHIPMYGKIDMKF